MKSSHTPHFPMRLQAVPYVLILAWLAGLYFFPHSVGVHVLLVLANVWLLLVHVGKFRHL